MRMGRRGGGGEKKGLRALLKGCEKEPVWHPLKNPKYAPVSFHLNHGQGFRSGLKLTGSRSKNRFNILYCI